MLELAWRPRAHLDRESAAIYLGVEYRNPQAALAVMEEIDSAIERARMFPDSGGRMRTAGPHGREYRTVLAGSHTIYYRFDERALTVCRVLHQHQDLDIYAAIDLG